MRSDALRAYVMHGFRAQHDGISIKCSPEHEARTYEMGAIHETWNDLPKLRVPVWLVSGEVIPHTPGAIAALIANEVPGSTLVQWNDLGHFGPMQDPQTIRATHRTGRCGHTVTEVFALPETLSPSGTGTFQNCPLQFRFQNIQKLPQPPGAAAVKGNVVHRALELLFQLDAPLRTHAAAHDFLATAKTEFEPTYDITGLNLTRRTSHKVLGRLHHTRRQLPAHGRPNNNQLNRHRNVGDCSPRQSCTARHHRPHRARCRWRINH